MRIWVTRIALAAVSVAFLSDGAYSQTPPAAPVREGSRADALRLGRSELAKGDPDAARARAERLLQQNPADRDAYLLAIDALNMRGNRMEALMTYRKVVGAGREDFVLLAPIARAELDLALKSASPPLRDAARDLLARMAKEVGAAADATGAPPRDSKPFAAMARDKAPDRRAAGLEGLVDSESPDAKAAVVDALSDPDFQVRMSAINGVVSLHAQEAVPKLKAALGDPNPLLRVQAASALRRLGDGSGDAVLKDALASQFRGGRLVAARALRETGDTTSWVAAIAPLLDSEQPIERVMAAELLAATPHRDRAMTTLQDAMGDTNELVRDQASRVLTSEPDQPKPTPFAGLADDNPWVRLKAAETVLLAPPVVAARKADAAAKAAAKPAPKPSAAPARKP